MHSPHLPSSPLYLPSPHRTLTCPPLALQGNNASLCRPAACFRPPLLATVYRYLDLAAHHGADPQVYARVPFAFYRSSMRAASEILRARSARDAAAEAKAIAAAHALWCEHKLAPPSLPPPEPRPRVFANGYTVLNPFLPPPSTPS
jgi:hypothetical protein